MATMAINNDIFRWWMVAPPLLGGHCHNVTVAPLQLCDIAILHQLCVSPSQSSESPNGAPGSVQMSQQGTVLLHYRVAQVAETYKLGFEDFSNLCTFFWSQKVLVRQAWEGKRLSSVLSSQSSVLSPQSSVFTPHWRQSKKRSECGWILLTCVSMAQKQKIWKHYNVVTEMLSILDV